MTSSSTSRTASTGLGFGVWGLGFGVWGLGFGVLGLPFTFLGVLFRVQGLGFRVQCLRVTSPTEAHLRRFGARQFGIIGMGDASTASAAAELEDAEQM